VERKPLRKNGKEDEVMKEAMEDSIGALQVVDTFPSSFITSRTSSHTDEGRALSRGN
jgi:hypothetical protein